MWRCHCHTTKHHFVAHVKWRSHEQMGCPSKRVSTAQRVSFTVVGFKGLKLFVFAVGRKSCLFSFAAKNFGKMICFKSTEVKIKKGFLNFPVVLHPQKAAWKRHWFNHGRGGSNQISAFFCVLNTMAFFRPSFEAKGELVPPSEM